MSTPESLREDARRDAYDESEHCLSNDPYCGKAPPPIGSYEAYRQELCSACEDKQNCSRCGSGKGDELCDDCADEVMKR